MLRGELMRKLRVRTKITSHFQRPSRSAALRKNGICQICLRFRALPSGRPGASHLRTYFCANPWFPGSLHLTLGLSLSINLLTLLVVIVIDVYQF